MLHSPLFFLYGPLYNAAFRPYVTFGPISSERKVVEMSNLAEIFSVAHTSYEPIFGQKGQKAKVIRVG